MPRKQRFKPSRKPKPTPESEPQRTDPPRPAAREHDVEHAAPIRPLPDQIERDAANLPEWKGRLDNEDDLEPLAPMSRSWEAHPDDIER